MGRRVPGVRAIHRPLPRWMPHLTCLAPGFVGGAVVACSLLTAGAAADAVRADTGAGLRVMAEARDTIQRVYVDRAVLVPKQLTYGAISGMVDALGDTGHSRFLTPAMRRIQHDVTEGILEGIAPDVAVPLPPDMRLLYPSAEERMTVATLRSSRDSQVLRALDLLPH